VERRLMGRGQIKKKTDSGEGELQAKRMCTKGSGGGRQLVGGRSAWQDER